MEKDKLGVNSQTVAASPTSGSRELASPSVAAAERGTAGTAAGAGAVMSSEKDGAAATQLEAMGYQQEMRRSLGMISVLGLSFAIMAVPFGTSTTLNIALTDGGPVTILYGVSDTFKMGLVGG